MYDVLSVGCVHFYVYISTTKNVPREVFETDLLKA